MAYISQGRSLSALRIRFMASLGRITPRVPGFKFLVADASSDNPRILAAGKRERRVTSKRMSNALSSQFKVSGFREPLNLIPIQH